MEDKEGASRNFKNASVIMNFNAQSGRKSRRKLNQGCNQAQAPALGLRATPTHIRTNDHCAFTEHPGVKGSTKRTSFASQKGQRFYLYEVPRAVKFLNRKQNGGCQELRGEGNRELVFDEYSFNWGRQKNSRWVVVLVAPQCKRT